MTRIFASAAVAAAALVAAVPSIGVAAQASDRSQLEANFATSSGQSYTLSQLGAEEADRGTVRDNQQLVVHPGLVVATPGTARIGTFPPQNVAQLIADGDLTPAQAKDMTLSQVVARKFLRDNSM